MPEAAYYDFFRKIVLQPDNVTIEADNTRDILTITGGNGVALNPNASTDSFEIDVDYELYVPIGTTEIRLNDVNSNHTGVTISAGSNIQIGRNSNNELTITSTVGGTSKAISNITLTSPIVITTTNVHSFTEGIAVTITDVAGTVELNGNEYYMDILTSTTFALYQDSNLTTPVDGTVGFTAYSSGGVAVAEYGAPQALSQLADVDLVGTPPVNGTYLQYNGSYWQAGTTLNGDFTGSVFADDSSLMVDGVNGKIVGDVETASLKLSSTSPNFLITDTDGYGNGVTQTLEVKKYLQHGWQIDAVSNSGTGNLQIRADSGTYALSIYPTFMFMGVASTFNSTVMFKDDIFFEGSTNDSFETRLTVEDPTADNIITIPDTTGTIALTSQLNGVENQLYVGDVNGNVNGNLTGDIKGSVFADDSTLLVDGVNGIVPSANISGTEANDWSTAYGWGDHSQQGYLTSVTLDDVLTTGNSSATGIDVGNSTIGALIITGTTLDTTDSSAITITPSVAFDTEITVSDVVPSLNTAIDLGSSSLRYREVHSQTINAVDPNQAGILGDGRVRTNRLYFGDENYTSYFYAPSTSYLGFVGNLDPGNIFHNGSTYTRWKSTGQLVNNFSTPSGTVDVDFLVSDTVYFYQPSGALTVNFTNIPDGSSRMFNMRIYIAQSFATPNIPTAVQVNGVAQTIEWQNGVVPTATAANIDFVQFLVWSFGGGSYVVLGQSNSYA
jgi:hypothetical protein